MGNSNNHEIEANPVGILSRLNINLIQHILTFLTYQELVALAQTKSIFKTLSSKKEELLNGRGDMDDLYLEVIPPIMKQSIRQVQVIVTTKDQGWASVPGSSSWVELCILNNEKQKIHSENVVHNYQEKQFKKVKKVFDEQSKLVEILNESEQEVKLGVFARSMYPGWVCHMKNAEIYIIYI